MEVSLTFHPCKPLPFWMSFVRQGSCQLAIPCTQASRRLREMPQVFKALLCLVCRFYGPSLSSVTPTLRPVRSTDHTPVPQLFSSPVFRAPASVSKIARRKLPPYVTLLHRAVSLFLFSNFSLPTRPWTFPFTTKPGIWNVSENTFPICAWSWSLSPSLC